MSSSLGVTAQKRTAGDSLREYGRGAIGGLLFSLPLLYTMEMWWTGFRASGARLLCGLAVTFLLLLLYNRFAGMRRDSSWLEVAIDSTEELGIGLLQSAVILFVIGEVRASTGAREALGKIVVEALPVAIGVSVGTAQLGESRDVGKSGDTEGNPLVRELSLATCGAFLFAANIAPTDEVEKIAVDAGAVRLLLLVLLSLAAAVTIVHFAQFRGARARSWGGTRGALATTAITYAVALLTSAAALLFFGRFAGNGVVLGVALTVVLAFPATLGASAGRILLQP